MANGERPADITIVGLGPGPVAQRTLAAQKALDDANRIFVRAHEGFDIADLSGLDHVTDIDKLRQPDTAPGGRWARSIAMVFDAAATSPVAVAIPGHPRFGEGLVRGLIAEAAGRQLSTSVIDGVSVIDLVATALGIDPILEGVQPMIARESLGLVQGEPFAGGRLTISPLRPVLLTHVYDRAICAALGDVLEPMYPAGHPVTWIEAAGSDHEVLRQVTVGDIRGLNGGPLVALWIPPMDALEAGADPRTMQHIVARLRRPDGCPWDRKQTHESLRNALIDEAYEAVDAIDRGDPTNLAEELGDLFMLILMQAQIAHEAGTFSIEDVYRGITTKIVGRHPHVFGDELAGSAEDVVGIWAEAKAREKARKGDSGAKDLDGEPFSMPALTRASRVLRKHPLVVDDDTPELLRLVAGILADGDDPEEVLRNQLRDHVETNS